MFDPNALAPLSALVRKYPMIEAEVIWAENGVWSVQDDEDEGLDGDEIPFYAEGLLMEGYAMAWQVLGIAGPEFVRLFFWQGARPALPHDEDLLSQGEIAP